MTIPRIVIEGDSVAEVLDLLRRISPEMVASELRPGAFAAIRGDIQQFETTRSENQRRIIQALRDARGALNLRAVERRANLKGLRLAGSLASLNRSGKSILGAPVVEPGPWFTNSRGKSDREYKLNPAFLEHEPQEPPPEEPPAEES